MQNKSKVAFELARRVHSALYELAKELREKCEKFDAEELADLAHCFKKVSSYLDDTRKEADETVRTAERLAVLRQIRDNQQLEPIRTDYCTATPQIKTVFEIPTFKKHPKQYAALMTLLAIDPQLWDQGEILTEEGRESTEVVKVHWPGFQAWANRFQEAGYSLPPEIRTDKQWSEYTLRTRAGKEIVTASESQQMKFDDIFPTDKESSNDECPF